MRYNVVVSYGRSPWTPHSAALSRQLMTELSDWLTAPRPTSRWWSCSCRRPATSSARGRPLRGERGRHGGGHPSDRGAAAQIVTLDKPGRAGAQGRAPAVSGSSPRPTSRCAQRTTFALTEVSSAWPPPSSP
ncbi:MAG: hypothetical protein R2734_11770 [Nocardioides sp.]